ncbi:hypothetical protein GCM10009117_03680 [Gangjinia marincola]|uniref:Glycosyltransferase 2-like domain-containing protein n=1 Tax=Gangjinia marincola TaxID=578463 RepID=A0ABN1MDQ8_9FLAO
MLFHFLKYIQPVHYFRKCPLGKNSIYPDPSHNVDFNQYNLNKENNQWSTLAAKSQDLSWQLLQRGLIKYDKTLEPSTDVGLADQYRFIRRYFKSVWSYYCLLIRIATFKNPFREIEAFNTSRSVHKVSMYKNPIHDDGFETFRSSLIERNPKISVIIPTLNRYDYLLNGLKDLEQQTYRNFDVFVVDQSEPFDAQFYEQFKLDLKVLRQEEKALWLARNTAIKASDAAYFLLYDDDSSVDENWIKNHLKCLDFFDAQISSGVSISTIGDNVPENYSFFRIADQLDTGNVLIQKKVFKEIGLFDRQFEKQRMGDGEFGMRAYLAGFRNISNPLASRVHYKASSGGLRQMGAWDAFKSSKVFDPKPIPSVLYYYRKYFGRKASILALLKSLPFSMIPYRFKKNKLLLLPGVLIALLLLPLLLFQVGKSWRLSSIKLKEGADIESYAG